jgi:hypothetical protein
MSASGSCVTLEKDKEKGLMKGIGLNLYPTYV